MENRYIKLQAPGCNVPLKVVPGHFATNHSHINYYIDMTTLKTRVSEAQEVARDLVGLYLYNTFVDTIVCLDGMDVVGAYLAEELTKAGVMSRNAHQTIYVVTPEYTSNSQMIFRDNGKDDQQGSRVYSVLWRKTPGNIGHLQCDRGTGWDACELCIPGA